MAMLMAQTLSTHWWPPEQQPVPSAPVPHHHPQISSPKRKVGFYTTLQGTSDLFNGSSLRNWIWSPSHCTRRTRFSAPQITTWNLFIAKARIFHNELHHPLETRKHLGFDWWMIKLKNRKGCAFFMPIISSLWRNISSLDTIYEDIATCRECRSMLQTQNTGSPQIKVSAYLETPAPNSMIWAILRSWTVPACGSLSHWQSPVAWCQIILRRLSVQLESWTDDVLHSVRRPLHRKGSFSTIHQPVLLPLVAI